MGFLISELVYDHFVLMPLQPESEATKKDFDILDAREKILYLASIRLVIIHSKSSFLSFERTQRVLKSKLAFMLAK